MSDDMYESLKAELQLAQPVELMAALDAFRLLIHIAAYDIDKIKQLLSGQLDH